MALDLDTQAVAIYCLLDDFFARCGPAPDARQQTRDSEVAATALISSLYFSGNQHLGRLYMQSHHKCCLIDKSGYSRRLHKRWIMIRAFFGALAGVAKQINTQSCYVIDSFPVKCCHNIRIARSKLLKDSTGHRSRSASKREWYFGFKVQLIVTEQGVPVDFFVHAASFGDQTALGSNWQLDLAEGSELYADAGYLSQELTDLLLENEGIKLLCQKRKNAREPHSQSLKMRIDHYCKRIETAISEITNRFGHHIHAVTPQGFILKVECFIIAQTLKCLLNT